jgi:hypothetical protein
VIFGPAPFGLCTSVEGSASFPGPSSNRSENSWERFAAAGARSGGSSYGFKRALTGRQDHDHLLAFHPGLIFDLGHRFEVSLDLLKQLHPQFGVRQFAAAEA